MTKTKKRALLTVSALFIAGAGASLVGTDIIPTPLAAQMDNDIQTTGETMSKSEKDEKLKNLSEMQYNVTQKDGTERPFDNAYWDNKEPGIYVDIVSGEPLFSSLDKFKSGSGWPSFTKPITEDAVKEKTDFKMILPRTEIRSVKADSHLGHVFKDGPADRGGLRYCMNSASMRFIHKDDLEKEGYGEFSKLFE